MDEQSLRYARHIALAEIGIEGQQRIGDSSALIIGLGGLGSPVSTYLAGAGVGRLFLSDFDCVDLSNLHRQTLYRTSDITRQKTVAAAANLSELNAEVELEIIDQRLNENELLDWIGKSDIVLDCSDNFGTRFAVNRACVARRTPLVSGAAIRFEGHISVFVGDGGDVPCYRCLYDESAETLEDCVGSGILGPVAGVVGSLMAVEALKLLADCGEPAYGRLLIYDALAAQWREVTIRRDAECPVCGVR
jgi:molybdopterin/thiamine biosynthesis adenylyltransferase